MTVRADAPVEVRPGRAEDLASINEIYNRYIVASPATFDVEPHSLEWRRAWFEQFSESGRYRLLVAERDGTVVGFTHSLPVRPKKAYETSVETTIYVAEGMAGRGVGTRLYAALFEALAAEDLHRAYAGITLPNPASVALHERFGFRIVGTFREQGRKLGRYWDVAWYEKEL